MSGAGRNPEPIRGPMPGYPKRIGRWGKGGEEPGLDLLQHTGQRSIPPRECGELAPHGQSRQGGVSGQVWLESPSDSGVPVRVRGIIASWQFSVKLGKPRTSRRGISLSDYWHASYEKDAHRAASSLLSASIALSSESAFSRSADPTRAEARRGKSFF